MLYELEKEDYTKVEHLFTKLKDNAAIESIFNYKNEARIFVDDLDKPKSLFILNSWAYYYLAGDSNNKVFNAALVEFLENEFFPQCVKSKTNLIFAFYPDSDSWCKKVEELFGHLNLSKSGKTYFIYNKHHFNKSWRESIPAGYSIKRVSKDIIDSIKDNKEFIDYINCFWENCENYFEKGLGYCAINKEDFCTICISVFASENEREIGIKTFDNFRRKGLAYVIACAYIEECLENNLIPVWSCFSENEISMKLAQKLGYKVESIDPIYFAEIGA